METWTDLGGIEVRSLIVSRFRLDGGAMFGQVPKPLWARYTKADAQNRIPLVVRALAVRRPETTLLIEAGMGSNFMPKEIERLEVEAPEGDLARALSGAGIDPSEVEHLILTHLHFDHAAGVGGEEGVQLPRARVYVQREHWERARTPGLKERGSFRPQDLDLIESMPLTLVDGEAEILPGIRVRASDGHTRGMQTVEIIGDADRVTYASDLIPTLAHVRAAYTMGYDGWPEKLVEEKEALLAEIARTGGMLVFVHDPDTAACRIQHGSGGFSVRTKEEL